MQTIKTMTPERAEQIKAREIDFSDIPEVTDFEGFSFRNKKINKVISVTLEMDNFEWLTSKGVSYQQGINTVIRWAREHECPLP